MPRSRSRPFAKSEAGAPEEAPEGTAASSSFPKVAIGASAGGLEAFSALLKALDPNLGMAYILVPHLDPSRKSSFTQILARTTAMPVVQIAEDMRVEPDHVYIIPPNCDLTIHDSVLHLRDREMVRTGNTTIDTFMRSLAADSGSNAIGVVLSGTASDGALGVTAIKGEGGITFAQDLQSAKYEGMPASAISSGFIDFVLPPEEIARELARIRHHPYVNGSSLEVPPRDGEENGNPMGQIFQILRRATKVDFSEYKPPTIRRRIHRRMALHRIEDLEGYIALLRRDRNEVNALYRDLLINVTSFFRNPEAFEALKKIVYPEIIKTRASSSVPIRIWVPGCSTGEEPYSHAIALMEFLSEERIEAPVQIFGTDLSENAVQRARAGIFKESIEADVSTIRLRRFFHKTDSGYQIGKAIRDLCIFSTQNVFRDPPFSRMDMVSCRNVMIYLGQALQKRIIPIFHYALNPAGFLMIGNTEGLLGAGSELFELADKKQKIYRKKLISTPQIFGFSLTQSELDTSRQEAHPQENKSQPPSKAPGEVQREADRLLLSRYAPPAVVVNNQMEILQSRGRTGNFLELPPGKASLNLLKMARPGLVYELQSALEEAHKTSGEIIRDNVGIDGDEGMLQTRLRVVPFKTPTHEQHNYLIIFEPTGHDRPAEEASASRPLSKLQRSEKDKQIGQLKQELAATKEYLQAIIEAQEATNEELQSANEEIQSGNEELQSTNEELQTSKEELESANEELHTVNEEMQHRNELLTQLNNDLTNLLNSVNLSVVMVGSDLSVRRFTPQASSTLGLMASDIGRPMPRLKLKIDVGNLEEILLDVIQEVQPRQDRVQDQDGGWWTLRITPYRTLDNRIDGAVLTFLDASAFVTPAS